MPSPSTIRTTRLSLGLTQAQAGAVVWASARTWRAWEAGFRVMPGSKWELFQFKAEYIGVESRTEIATFDAEGNMADITTVTVRKASSAAPAQE